MMFIELIIEAVYELVAGLYVDEGLLKCRFIIRIIRYCYIINLFEIIFNDDEIAVL